MLAYFIIDDSVALIDYKNYSLYEFEDIHTLVNDTTVVERKVINRYFLYRKKDL